MIMLMNINNDTHEVSLMSVYRDTYLNVAGEGQEEKFQKANAAYAYGGPEQAVTMLNRNLDIDIDNYVAFDFKAVAQAIDILGGVDIDVESEEERKYLNDYVSYTSEYVGGSDEEVEHTGLQTLNGVQAVSYARIRYTAGDDYKTGRASAPCSDRDDQEGKICKPDRVKQPDQYCISADFYRSGQEGHYQHGNCHDQI